MAARLTVTLPPEIAGRVRDWAALAGLPVPQAVDHLLDLGLDVESVDLDDLDAIDGLGAGDVDEVPLTAAAADADGPLALVPRAGGLIDKDRAPRLSERGRGRSAARKAGVPSELGRQGDDPGGPAAA
jgi:hypothetical protein